MPRKASEIDNLLITLLRREPFFASFTRHFRKEASERLPTAGVYFSGTTPVLAYNPEFMASLNMDEQIGLLKHECYHVIFNHCTTRRREPHMVWNYATDLAINSMIEPNELPPGALYPGGIDSVKPQKLKEKEDASEEESMIIKKAKEANNKINEFIKTLPVMQSSEWYYDQFMQNKEIQQAMKTLQMATGKGLIEMPGGSHDAWGDMSDEERRMLEDEIKKHAKRAMDECNRTNKWGNISAEARKMLRDMIITKINWKEILNYFIGNTKRGEKYRTHRRTSRKYPHIHPGVKRRYNSSIAIYIDQSGSVGDDDISLFFDALSSLAHETEFTIFHFDSTVDEESERVWKKKQKIEVHRTRCGGTCFQAVTDHFHRGDNIGRFDGYIIMTDGYAPKPSRSRKKRCYMICPSGDEKSFDHYREDTVIKMSHP